MASQGSRSRLQNSVCFFRCLCVGPCFNPAWSLCTRSPGRASRVCSGLFSLGSMFLEMSTCTSNVWKIKVSGLFHGAFLLDISSASWDTALGFRL